MSVKKCKNCGSYAVNPHCHGRHAGIDLDLCDVCYWRLRADYLAAALEDARTAARYSARDPVAEKLAKATRTYLEIYADYLEFDGDRRGIADCLRTAREELRAALVKWEAFK